MLAAISANSAFATPASLIVTAPEDTEKLSEENDATPLADVVASSPAMVTVLPVAELFNPEPPATVSVSESRSIAIEPLSVVMSKSSAVTLESTYALMDCCVASLTALSDDMVSSSLMPVTVAPSPAILTLVLATIVVPVIAAGVAPPITAPSIVPALTSTELLVSGSTAKVIQASLA